jgi:hypothetical protein
MRYIIGNQIPKRIRIFLRKVVNRQIAEAESIVSRNVNEKNLGNLQKPLPAMSESLSPSERVSREELMGISDLYFDAIEQSNGELVPWDPECYRVENAVESYINCSKQEIDPLLDEWSKMDLSTARELYCESP